MFKICNPHKTFSLSCKIINNSGRGEKKARKVAELPEHKLVDVHVDFIAQYCFGRFAVVASINCVGGLSSSQDIAAERARIEQFFIGAGLLSAATLAKIEMVQAYCFRLRTSASRRQQNYFALEWIVVVPPHSQCLLQKQLDDPMHGCFDVEMKINLIFPSRRCNLRHEHGLQTF